MIVIRHGSSVLKPGAQRRPGRDAASERFAIMAEHSTSVLIENQIAWDFLERSGEIEDPYSPADSFATASS